MPVCSPCIFRSAAFHSTMIRYGQRRGELPRGGRPMLVGKQLGPFAHRQGTGQRRHGRRLPRRLHQDRPARRRQGHGPRPRRQRTPPPPRFEREAAILKQLNHPNIVRLFGIGKLSRHAATTRWSTSRASRSTSVMARRGRLTWEEVVDLRQAALRRPAARPRHRHHPPRPQAVQPHDPQGRHAQAHRLRHRQGHSTSPRLTAANCTVGTAAYMSPEQCRASAT